MSRFGYLAAIVPLAAVAVYALSGAESAGFPLMLATAGGLLCLTHMRPRA